MHTVGKCRLLDERAESTELSGAHAPEPGIPEFTAERAGIDGPMQTFMRAMREKPLPADIAEAHDDYLARG